MRYFFLILVLTTALTGCVLPSDIRALQASGEAFRLKVATDVEAFKAGIITESEFEARLEKAEKKQDEEIEKVAEAAEKRSAEIAELARQVAEGSVDITTLGTSGGTTLIGLILLHLWRNGTRKNDIKRAFEEE